MSSGLLCAANVSAKVRAANSASADASAVTPRRMSKECMRDFAGRRGCAPRRSRLAIAQGRTLERRVLPHVALADATCRMSQGPVRRAVDVNSQYKQPLAATNLARATMARSDLKPNVRDDARPEARSAFLQGGRSRCWASLACHAYRYRPICTASPTKEDVSQSWRRDRRRACRSCRGRHRS